MTTPGTTSTVLRPATLDDAAAALADTTGTVLISGAGTAADWAGRPDRCDLTLDTTALTGIITHNPGDMTVSVRAGTPLRVLNQELATHGQRVAFDAARVGFGATLGGLVATADAGPSALVHGSLRDLIIGSTVVLADGGVARSGGHVIKNVAGYDLSKLLHGCHGTLALVAEVILRLHPVPAAEATVRLSCALEEAAAATRTVLASPLESAAVEWCDGALLVRVTGAPSTVEARAGRLAELLGPPAETLAPDTAAAAWQRHRESVSGSGTGTAILRIGTRPSRLHGALAALVADLGGADVVAGLGTGVATLALPPGPETIDRAHQLVHQAGGTSMLRSRPPGCTAPAWGPPPSAIDVLRAVRTELDPRGRFGGGRFSPWM